VSIEPGEVHWLNSTVFAENLVVWYGFSWISGGGSAVGIEADFWEKIV
jgi:hypothetical protein